MTQLALDLPQCGRTFTHVTHTTTDGQCPGLDPIFPGMSRDPWATPTPDRSLLLAGLKAIHTDAVLRRDSHTAHLASTVLSGHHLDVAENTILPAALPTTTTREVLVQRLLVLDEVLTELVPTLTQVDRMGTATAILSALVLD